MKRCPHCGEQDHDDAIICKYCIRYFNAPVAAPAGGKGTGRARERKANASRGNPLRIIVMAGALWFLFQRLPDVIQWMETTVQSPAVPGGEVPLRVGGDIQAPRRTREVPPRYPPDAESAGVQGEVMVEAVIDATGRVGQATVVRSIPLLDEAALEAVRQWEYEPAIVNGVPVPVVMTVTVRFTLR